VKSLIGCALFTVEEFFIVSTEPSGLSTCFFIDLPTTEEAESDEKSGEKPSN